MQKRMIFTLFLMNSVSHAFHGYWRHPLSRSREYKTLDMWTDLAIKAETARMDAMFFADGVGIKGEYKGSQDILFEKAIQVPSADPSVMFSALAAATEHLGFIYTNSVVQQHPFNFARAISSLDHYTKGRIGWNIVTSATENAYRNFGLEGLPSHEERYASAEEYMEVLYKLWEGSWEVDAVVNDAERGIYADPRKVHKINHVGPRYRVEGPHLVEPTPQRVPMLFQAGASKPGLDFATRHAEAAFISTRDPEVARKQTALMRNMAVERGRRAEDMLFLEGLAFVVGSTEEEARRKNREQDQYLSLEAQVTFQSSMSGIDLGKFDPDVFLEDILDEIPGIRGTFLGVINAAPSGTKPTLREYLYASFEGIKVIGTPETIADRIAAFSEAGVDGIQLINILLPGSYDDFFEHVVPVLQKRGIMQREYAPGTLREKLFPNSGPHIADTHPARGYRKQTV